MLWTNVGGLLKSGNVWTTPDKRPGASGLKKIVTHLFSGLVPFGENIDFSVAHIGLPYRNFIGSKGVRGVEIKFTGASGLLHPEELPRYCTDSQASGLIAMRSLAAGIFDVHDLAKRMYPEVYYRGSSVRGVKNKNLWGPNKRCFDSVYDEKSESYDFEQIAKNRTQNFLQSAKKEGWVEHCGYGKWRRVI